MLEIFYTSLHLTKSKFANIFHFVEVVGIGVLCKTRPFVRRNISNERLSEKKVV